MKPQQTLRALADNAYEILNNSIIDYDEEDDIGRAMNLLDELVAEIDRQESDKLAKEQEIKDAPVPKPKLTPNDRKRNAVIRELDRDIDDLYNVIHYMKSKMDKISSVRHVDRLLEVIEKRRK